MMTITLVTIKCIRTTGVPNHDIYNRYPCGEIIQLAFLLSQEILPQNTNKRKNKNKNKNKAIEKNI